MKHIYLPRIALAESARESVSSAARFAFNLFFFCLEQENLRLSRYIIWQIFT